MRSYSRVVHVSTLSADYGLVYGKVDVIVSVLDVDRLGVRML